MSENCKKKIAVFIDGENVLPLYAEQVFSYAEGQGIVSRKEIYGASMALNDWSEQILRYAIHMNMTIRPTRFKNSSDIALTVGVMDLLISHTVAEVAATLQGLPNINFKSIAVTDEQINTIIIVSSDSDFSVLSLRMRNAGIKVIGMGEKKSNPMWRASCSSFVELSSENSAISGLFPSQSMLIQPAAARFTQNKQNPSEDRKNEIDSVGNIVSQRKDNIIRISPTHLERVNVIRAFIMEQLAGRNGRMQSSELFSLLSNLPDYQFDQQRSQRKPLDYLARQYGDYFKFSQEADGEIWIFAAEIKKQVNNENGEISSPLTGSIEMESGAKTNEKALNCPSDTDIILKEAGIDDENAKKIVMICNNNKELKGLYNCFRTSFGSEKGREYYHIIKKYRDHFLKTSETNEK